MATALALTTLASAQFNLGFRWSGGSPFGIPARLTAVAADPRSSTTLLAASPGGGLWKTTDGATTWGPISNSAQSQQICSLAFDPANPDNLFLGTGNDQSLRANLGVVHSPDGGTTWTLSSGFSATALCALAVDPSNSTHVLAGSLSGVFLSLDSGATWKQVSQQATQSLVFDPAANGVVYAATYSPPFFNGTASMASPVLKSSDGGMTWTALAFNPADSVDPRAFQRASVAVGASGMLYVAVSYLFLPTSGSIDLFTSTDGGMTFSVQPKVAPVANGGRLPLLYDMVNNYLYLGGTSLYRAVAMPGASPLTFTLVKHPAIGNLNSLTFNLMSTPPALVAGGDLGMINVPLDGTAATQVNNPAVSIFTNITVDPQAAQVLLLSGEEGLRIYAPFYGTWRRAVTTGTGFTVVTNTSPENVYSMGTTQFNRSADGGVTFKSFTAIGSTEARAPNPPLLVDPIVPTTLYTAGQRAYRSLDGGQTWTALSNVIDTAVSGSVVTALAFSPLIRQIMYAAVACLPAAYPAPANCPATTRVFISQNSGATWTLLTSIPGYVSRLVVDPGVPTAVYAVVGAFPGGPNVTVGLSSGNIYVIRVIGGTTGITTTSLIGNLPDAPINAIAMAPGAFGIAGNLATTYYIATDIGVFGTTNGGTSWVSLSYGLPNVPITDLLLQNMTQGTFLTATTYGHGYYQALVPTGALTPTVTPLGANLTVTQGQAVSIPVTVKNTGSTPIDIQIATNDPWISISPSSEHLVAGQTVILFLKADAASLAVGAYRTKLQVVRVANAVTPADFPQDISVKLTVTKPPASLLPVGTLPSTFAVGAQVSLAVQALDAGGLPLSGISVAFRILTGSGQLSFGSVPTDSQGMASTVLTLPAQPGTTTIAATAAGLTANFSVTSVKAPQPALNSGAAVNAASFTPGTALAPGSIFSLFGTQLATSVSAATSLPLPTALSGTQVFLGGVAVPLFYASQTQINALVPFEATPGVSQLAVQYPGVSGAVMSNSIDVTIAAVAPGIFTQASTGTGLGVFVKPDGSLAAAQNPVKRGTTVTFYATGLGAVSPAIASGAAAGGAPNLSKTVATPAVNMGGVDAVVQFSGLAPGFAGLYQINAVVPATVQPESNVPVTLRMGLAVSNSVTIPIN